MSGQEGEKPQEDTEWGAGRMRERRRGGGGERGKREGEIGRVEREKTRRRRSPLMSKR